MQKKSPFFFPHKLIDHAQELHRRRQLTREEQEEKINRFEQSNNLAKEKSPFLHFWRQKKVQNVNPIFANSVKTFFLQFFAD